MARSTPMHILHAVGVRANFMKVAPVMAALEKHGVRQTLVHTGQIGDAGGGDAILRELGLPEPDVNLNIGAGSPAEQTAQLIVAMERCLLERRPDLVLVYGDGDVTMGAALTAVKLGFDLGHVEAGLRSDDGWTSAAVNRVVTDRLSSWLFTPSDDADENLLAEGTNPAAIKLVGNVMIDTLIRLLPQTQPEPLLQVLGVRNGKGTVSFALVTLNKPETIDDQPSFDRLLDALTELARDIPVVFPAHPRTRRRMKDHHLKFSGLLVTEPMTYLQFLGLQQHAKFVITDSGSIQEETTFLGVPCLTVRDSTERPVTTSIGTNVLVGRDPEVLIRQARQVLAGRGKRGVAPALWDGQAARSHRLRISSTERRTQRIARSQQRSQVQSVQDMPLRIGFDMDGVVADFSSAFHEVEQRLFGPGEELSAGEPEKEEESQTAGADDEDADAAPRAPEASASPRRGPAEARSHLAGDSIDARLLDHAEADRRRRRAAHPRDHAATALGGVLHHAAPEDRRGHGAAADAALAGRAGLRSAKRARARRIPRRGGRSASAQLPRRRQPAELHRRDRRFQGEAYPRRRRR